MNHFIFINKDPLTLDSSVEVTPGMVIPGVQIAPFGDFPSGDVMQHLTRDSFAAIIKTWEDNGKPELLVDFEHKSEAGGSEDTSAAAWASNLAISDDLGLIADFTLTDLGETALGNRRLRFLSPVFACNVDKWNGSGDERRPAEVTPFELVSVALTNTPNLPVKPIINKSPEVQGSDPEPKTQKENPNMDKIKEALGLAPESTEEDILAAIGAMTKANKEAEEARKAEEAATLEKEAEEFAEENAKKCNKDVLKAQYLANKEVAKAIVAGIPEVKEEPQQILNKAKNPETKDIVAALKNCKGSAERIAFAKAHAQELLDAAK